MNLSQLHIMFKANVSKYYSTLVNVADETIAWLKNKKGMPHSKKGWLVTLLSVLIIAAGAYFIFRPKHQIPELPIVKVETVNTGHVNIYGEYVGRIRAQQYGEIHARVEGYLQSMLFKEGSYIHKGQTLFIIDPRLYQARLKKNKTIV